MAAIRTVIIKEVDEQLKRRIVQGLESGKMSQMDACREYGMSRTSLQKWVKQYGRARVRIKRIEVVMKDQTDKIKELQQALGEAQLKVRFYEKMLEIASRDCGYDLKKKLATKLSESSESKTTQK
jgi:transposase